MRRSARSATALALGVPVLLIVVMAWHRRWIGDDGFINLRILDNLRHGYGPVFNVDERVEAYSSALWLAMLWLGSVVLPFLSLETVAVVLGVLCAGVGIGAATYGSYRVWRIERDAVPVPFGVAAVLAVAPFWDYSTSGLDSAVSFAWLGLSFLLLAASPVRARAAAVLIGLGPLVRPDLTVFAAGFLAVLLFVSWPERGRRSLLLVVWAALVPVAYEIFRMGYFAELVPNTAVAKAAAQANWDRGWFYLRDFVGAYWLWIPLLLGALATVALLRRLRGTDARPRLALVVVTLVCALLHGVFVVRVGGDFMHARLLLPTVFGLLLPVMVVPLRPVRLVAPATLALLVWGVISATSLRGEARFDRYELENPRQYLVENLPVAHPVALKDYRGLPFGFLEYGEGLRKRAAGEPVVIIPKPGDVLREVAPGAGTSRVRVFATAGAIGITGFAAGPAVHIVDVHGLADPLAARLPVGNTHKAGHEKTLDADWALARFAAPDWQPPAGEQQDVQAARRALGCGALSELLHDVTAPLTAGRFFDNLGGALEIRSLHVAADPVTAERDLCQP